MAVIGFHVSPAYLRGGFVGVDIFFVISGFLISNIILNERQAGTFSYANFYAHRIRRIFPALIVVLFMTAVLGAVILTPYEYEELGKHIFAGALFSSNFLLWSEVGYFDAPAELKPLLHLWSLSIEEQFYLLWPVTLAVIWKLRKGYGIIVTGLMLTSFLLYFSLIHDYPDSAFYLPHPRFWQLLSGALLAIFTFQHKYQTFIPDKFATFFTPYRIDILCNSLASGGFVLILIAITFFEPNSIRAAVFPTVGAGMLIAAGSHALLNRKFLANKGMVYVGLISYPLYLWHWPLLSFIHILDFKDSLEVVLNILAIISAVIAAVLTYQFVELPARRGNIFILVRRYSVIMVMVVVLGSVIILTEGISIRLSDDKLALRTQARTEDLNFPKVSRKGICFLQSYQLPEIFGAECQAKGKPTLFLWGDSYAAHLYQGLKELTPNPDEEISQYNSANCPPLVGYKSTKQKHCMKTNELVIKEIQKHKPVTVVIAGNWHVYAQQENFLPLLRDTLFNVKLYSEVILVGPVVSFPVSQVKLALRADSESYENEMLPRLRQIDAALRNLAYEINIKYVSPISALCESNSCSIMIKADNERKLLAWDFGHLTVAGSSFYARTLINPLLREKSRNSKTQS